MLGSLSGFNPKVVTGNFEKSSSSSTDLSNDEFKQHFEDVLNSLPAAPISHVSTDVIIPVLVHPTSTTEVENQVKIMRVGKAVGHMALLPVSSLLLA